MVQVDFNWTMYIHTAHPSSFMGKQNNYSFSQLHLSLLPNVLHLAIELLRIEYAYLSVRSQVPSSYK